MSRSPSRPVEGVDRADRARRRPHDVGAAVLLARRARRTRRRRRAARRRPAGARRASRRWPGGPARRSGARTCWCGTRRRSPGTHQASVAAIAAVIRSQSNRSSSVRISRMAGTPARWVRAWDASPWPCRPARTRATRRRSAGRARAALVDQLQRQQREEALADGVHVDERVVAPGRRPRLVGPPADEVDDDLAAHDHVHARRRPRRVRRSSLRTRPGPARTRGAVPADRGAHSRESSTGPRHLIARPGS